MNVTAEQYVNERIKRMFDQGRSFGWVTDALDQWIIELINKERFKDGMTDWDNKVGVLPGRLRKGRKTQ